MFYNWHQPIHHYFWLSFFASRYFIIYHFALIPLITQPTTEFLLLKIVSLFGKFRLFHKNCVASERFTYFAQIYRGPMKNPAYLVEFIAIKHKENLYL